MAFKEGWLLDIFKHFSLRLSERYGLFITFEQYMSICRGKFSEIGRSVKDKDAKIGLVYVNKTPVLVCKKRTGKFQPLITALPPTYDMNKVRVGVVAFED